MEISMDLSNISSRMAHNWSERHRWINITERYSFLLPAIIVLLFLTLYPIIYTTQLSLSTFDRATALPGEFVGLKNYSDAINNQYFWKSLGITFIIIAISLPIQMVLGILLAFLFDVKWPGGKIIRALMIIPMVATPVVIGSMWKMLLHPLWGFVNYVWGLLGGTPINFFSDPMMALASIIVIETWGSTPFVILMVTAGLAGLEPEPLEAAKVDGANWWQTFTLITLPMLKPVLYSTFIVRWLGAMKAFDIIFTATFGGPGNATLVANLFIWKAAFQSLNFDSASAMSMILLFLGVGFTVIFIRFSLGQED
jgi:multiple sugar transport system permease protein